MRGNDVLGEIVYFFIIFKLTLFFFIFGRSFEMETKRYCLLFGSHGKSLTFLLILKNYVNTNFYSTKTYPNLKHFFCLVETNTHTHTKNRKMSSNTKADYNSTQNL